MLTLKSRLLVTSLLSIVIISACKKSDSGGDDLTPPPPNPPTSAADKIKDTVVEISREIYLWYNQIPSSFNGRTYADPNKIMEAIRQFSIEPGFSTPVDRFSFAVKQQEWDNISSGIAGDFGLGVFFPTENDLRVKHVERESPAGKAGIRRGWRITKINGNDNINTSNVNFVVQNVFQSTSTSFTFQKPDNSTVTIALNAASYQENPVVLDSVYTIDSKKIGYFVFNSFLGDTSAIYNDFSRIFNRFAQAGVGDVIIDLRYNGGGYTSLAERLSNYLAPLAANGNLMMRVQYNNKLSQYNRETNFRKQGSLNLSRIFFIVSNSSASGSELVINNLKPYMEVLLVGPNKTYGKPVGYFAFPVGDWYIFPVSSRTVNKNGEANYFGGFALNYTVADGLDKDWGNTTESSFASALSYITSGVFRGQAAGTKTRVYQELPQVKEANRVLDLPSFKGTVDVRRIK
ncbi:MAG TPA: S41 family peptidase [Chitinophagaceae bacterium]|nr:S41 family peptidase [Chitinophagaceae bacterium]